MNKQYFPKTNNNASLQELGIPPTLEYLGEGMQCKVFADGPDRVIKLYPAEMGVDNLNRLMQFYHSLECSHVSFQTPEIFSVQKKMDKIIVSEKRLMGSCPTREMLTQMPEKELEIYFRNYVDVLFEIQKISTTFLQPAEPLDQSGDFYQYAKYKSWNALLITNLQKKLSHSQKRYSPFVPDLEQLTTTLFAKIDELTLDKHQLIHGDYFPENTMMDNDLNITAVLDFGTFTIMGDALFDIALGWIFADMYHNVAHFPINDFVGSLTRERIAPDAWQRLKLYILIYSILSANMYGSADINDGHFQWAMKNLNDENLKTCL